MLNAGSATWAILRRPILVAFYDTFSTYTRAPTGSVIYVTAHRCKGGLKKLNLRSCSQRLRHFVGFFNVPAQARGRPFYTVIPRKRPIKSPFTTRWGYGGNILNLTPGTQKNSIGLSKQRIKLVKSYPLPRNKFFTSHTVDSFMKKLYKIENKRYNVKADNNRAIQASRALDALGTLLLLQRANEEARLKGVSLAPERVDK